MTTTKDARSNYKKLYLKQCKKEFSQQFWKFDLPVIIAVSLTIAVILVCVSVPIANEIFKRF